MNGRAVSLIIETHVAAHNRHIESHTSVAHALNDLGKLPHDCRILRATEIQAIGQTERAGTNAGEIARRLRDRQYAPYIRIQITISAIAVDRES